MADSVAQPRSSFASGMGGLVGLIATEVGAALGVVGGLWAGFITIAAAERSREFSWPLYLIGGCIFVAIVVVCRWRGRA